MKRQFVTVDGNEAAAYVAHQTNEVIAIYPITPSSPMGEFADAWSAAGQKNIYGVIPTVIEMQHEGGAAGACHGALQGGALTTTFTASQGLLLMIPNMYKIAGELTSAVFHIAARTLATHCLSIFGDQSDVMAARATGWAMLCSNTVQEVQDFALISQAATLEARVPFLHFFDGFRTSHEVNKIEQLTPDDLRAMIPDELVKAHRERGLNPERPILRGSAQNPDVFFQAREACNPFYLAVPGIVQKTMDKFAGLVGRQYHLFDYVGAADAEDVIVAMGSGCGGIEETVVKLNGEGRKLGLVKVRLYRPFDVPGFLAALPATTKRIAALDRTKEPGAIGEPLYQDIVTALVEGWSERAGDVPAPRVIGGRYGLSSKEFTPAMVAGVFDELAAPKPKRHFTVGIVDDVTHLSLKWDPTFTTEPADTHRAVFYGLGSDGTVGANKNTVKIIGENTPLFAQGYFVYDSKKSGSVTVSHLRFSPRPINGSYLCRNANFVACHQFNFLEKMDVLEFADPGATFLLNSPYGPDEVWEKIPIETQRQIIDKKLKFYVIDAESVAQKAGLGRRHQHDHADLLLRDLGRSAPRRGDRRDQGHDQEDLRQARGDRAAAELRRCGHGHRRAVRGEGPGLDRRRPAPAAASAGLRSRLRQAGHRDDDRGQGRPAARQRLAGRRHLPDRDRALREAEHRAVDPDLGPRHLHPVRPLLPGLPARRDPHQGLPHIGTRQQAGRLSVGALQRQGISRPPADRAGRARRLHRLRRLR